MFCVGALNMLRTQIAETLGLRYGRTMMIMGQKFDKANDVISLYWTSDVRWISFV